MKTTADLQLEAVTIVKREKGDWEQGTTFVTEKVAFQIRPLLRTLRKNYWGVFDEPLDPTTGRKKIWIPLTEWIVESVVKNIDLDTKDINFRAKHRASIPFTSLIRSIVRNALDYMNFGEKLDEFERQLAIDGTAVWSTEEVDKEPNSTVVDLLNFYIDPTAHSISEAGSVIERIVISKPDFDALAIANRYMNREEAVGAANIARIDGVMQYNYQDTSGNTKFVELYRRRGWVPEYLITGKESDKKMVPGEIICSRQGSSYLLHDITRRKDNKNKGYEEAWYTRVPGRWYGRGAAEKVMMLQLWINTIVNIRINRSMVSQLGLFKIRQGSGITPAMISRLGANGALLVQSMGDIEQLTMSEASAASYKDEQSGIEWTRMVTSAFESVTGESLPSSTTATSAAITSRASNSSFELIKEGLGMFLQRWIKNQALPIILSNLKRGDVIHYYPEDLKAYDEMQVNQILYKKIEEIHNSGKWLDAEYIQQEQQRAVAQLQAGGKQRLMTYDDVQDVTHYDVEVEVTNEGFDKGVLMQNLLTALQAAPEYRDTIIAELFDVMGFPEPPKPQPQQQPPQQQPPAAVGTQNPNQQTTQANTGMVFGKAQALTNFATKQ